MWEQRKVTMSSIRFIRNVNLQVTFEDENTMVPFAFGDCFTVKRIEVDVEGYNDIYMPDGSVICGVSSEVFENVCGRVPVTVVTEIQPAIDNAEIFVEEVIVEPVVLDGTMLGESEDTHGGNEDRGKAQSFTTENE